MLPSCIVSAESLLESKRLSVIGEIERIKRVGKAANKKKQNVTTPTVWPSMVPKVPDNYQPTNLPGKFNEDLTVWLSVYYCQRRVVGRLRMCGNESECCCRTGRALFGDSQ